jgi:hypothetical protein
VGPDRAVAAAAVLMVTWVLVLVGFSGASDEFQLPGRWGWVYVGVVLCSAIGFFLFLSRRALGSKPAPARQARLSVQAAKRLPNWRVRLRTGLTGKRFGRP